MIFFSKKTSDLDLGYPIITEKILGEFRQDIFNSNNEYLINFGWACQGQSEYYVYDMKTNNKILEYKTDFDTGILCVDENFIYTFGSDENCETQICKYEFLTNKLVNTCKVPEIEINDFIDAIIIGDNIYFLYDEIFFTLNKNTFEYQKSDKSNAKLLPFNVLHFENDIYSLKYDDENSLIYKNDNLIFTFKNIPNGIYDYENKTFIRKIEKIIPSNKGIYAAVNNSIIFLKF